jgi:hypothetical protein
VRSVTTIRNCVLTLHQAVKWLRHFPYGDCLSRMAKQTFNSHYRSRGTITYGTKTTVSDSHVARRRAKTSRAVAVLGLIHSPDPRKTRIFTLHSMGTCRRRQARVDSTSNRSTEAETTRWSDTSDRRPIVNPSPTLRTLTTVSDSHVVRRRAKTSPPVAV